MIVSRIAVVVGIIAASTVLACASTDTLRSASSSEIGCPPPEIEIADDSGSIGTPRTWTARCNGKVYYCSGGAQSMKASCKEAQVSPSATRAPQ